MRKLSVMLVLLFICQTGKACLNAYNVDFSEEPSRSVWLGWMLIFAGVIFWIYRMLTKKSK